MKTLKKWLIGPVTTEQRKIIGHIGSLLGLCSYAAVWYFYDWKLALLIFLIVAANNMEQSSRRIK